MFEGVVSCGRWMLRPALILCLFLGVTGAAQASGSGPLRADLWAQKWTKLTDQGRAETAAAFQDNMKRPLGANATVDAFRLPWRADAYLVRIRGKWRPSNLVVYYLRDPKGRFHRLDGHAGVIHRFNGQFPPDITLANAPAYLGFFGFFVRTDKGPFVMIEGLADRFMPRMADRFAPLRAKIGATLHPMRCGTGQAGKIVCASHVYYGTALYRSIMQVDADGKVHMTDDRKIFKGLPYRVDAPITCKCRTRAQPHAEPAPAGIEI